MIVGLITGLTEWAIILTQNRFARPAVRDGDPKQHYNGHTEQRTIDSTEVADTDFRNGDFTCRDIGESGRSLR